MSANTTAQARFKHVIEYAREEAVLRGDRRIGTDHLLLALLHDGDAPPARALRVSLADGRAALEELDRAALAAIGVQLDMPLTPPQVRAKRLVNVNSAARAAITGAKAQAQADGSRRIEPRHLLLSLLTARHPDPAADLLAALSVPAEDVRARLAAA
ncbi:Clp amino terminal domain-containing protein, pathogenicity island component [Actinacidiphila rubida]|uniref:Clp amino terminal domain-containing protein, pathogenicity island component n=1 Tax=Actinacidiphila rubida TaxID=310780 RepID=A0A1H8NAQ2_9ACTN|nr:Clp protease N-terminal domain-containing protein [Actinacidiphila rubida]SEO26598.1 Clp amino terminal domain-containing protein, pathogenicity island component [Actinacidiphila rubida]